MGDRARRLAGFRFRVSYASSIHSEQTPMPELTCPECSSPIDLPVAPTRYFVSCETCSAQIEMPFALEVPPQSTVSEPTPEPIRMLKFPHCSEEIPAWASRFESEDRAIPPSQSTRAVVLFALFTAIVSTPALWMIFRFLF
jgi:hypothetical protein